ncbi:Ig-like domain-containing protein [Paenibacillus tarimensis]|uniref:Ig-like domain-containing protein n=1 Tax=Paenibacillus tarimensis TaxID=416012 RepID=UPI0022866C9E|nr:Ig-like domain-containing protein [Paenibacillus tarimensis]MCF2945310.1 Ig-like domain-containing protein [Paenibacillus tarimensis]
MPVYKFKKLSCLLLTFLLVFPLGVVHGGPNTSIANQFKDIKGHWAEADLQDWLSQGLLSGYPDQTVRPDETVTRGEFVTLVNRAFMFTEKAPIGFRDLKQIDWVYTEVQKAIKQGYIHGFTDNTFRSKQKISRQEAAVMLERIFSLEDKQATEKNSPADAAVIASWAQAAVRQVLSEGIMNTDSDGAFQPQRLMTRADSVVAIKKAHIATPLVFKQAGAFGDDTATRTLEQDVIITSPDVTLKNMYIKGDLTITDMVGDGNVYLNQVKVDGVTNIQGGGANSIHVKDSKLTSVSVNRINKAVRVVAEGSTEIQNTEILSSATIEEANITGAGFVNVSVLPGTQVSGTKVPDARNITISGNFKNVSLITDLDGFTAQSGIIARLHIGKNVGIRSLALNKSVTVQVLELESKCTVTGDGQIQEVVLSDAAKDSVVPQKAAPQAGVVTMPVGSGGGTGAGGGSSEGSNGAAPSAGTGGSSAPGTGGTPNPSNGHLSIESVLAANGYLTVSFNQTLPDAVSASDFAVTMKVNDGVYVDTESSEIVLLSDRKSVRITVPMLATAEEKNVVYAVSYKNAEAVLSQTLILSKQSTTVRGTLKHLAYYMTEPIPIGYMTIVLKGADGTTGEYSSGTGPDGAFKFENVAPGTYTLNFYLYPMRYYSEEFQVEAGKELTVPDFIIEDSAPEPSVENPVYTDIGYISGSVFNLDETYSLKVETEDGIVLNVQPGEFDMFFSFNLFDYNPDLKLSDGDKLYVTMYTDRWTSGRLEVQVMERPKTAAPVITKPVYVDTKNISGTVEDWSNEITVTTIDGTVIGTSHNNLGNTFSVYFSSAARLTVGDTIIVYAQANQKKKSDPTYVTVIAPTTATAPPTVTGVVYEGDAYISGLAERNASLTVKRSDGTIIGQGSTSEYHERFSISLSSLPVAGEMLYVTAKGYEKLNSTPVSVKVEVRPITPSPSIVGEVYNDFTYFTVKALPDSSVKVYLKDMNGNVMDQWYPLPDGILTFHNVEFVANTQYQITAVAPGMKESVPFVFTVIEPTEYTAVPTITVPVYGDEYYTVKGTSEPYAAIYLYTEDGAVLRDNIMADSQGAFSFMISEQIQPGSKLVLKADARGKWASEALEVTVVAPAEKSSQPVLDDSVIYGYTGKLSGYAAKRALINVFYEDGRQIYEGSYADMNTGWWYIGLASAILRGGDRIYIIADEPGKLPSDPLYITIQSAPKSITPIVTSIVTTNSIAIEGTYDGARVVGNRLTTILVTNESGQVIGSSWVNDNGSFTVNLYHSTSLTKGQHLSIVAKEGDKEVSESLNITVQ